MSNIIFKIVLLFASILGFSESISAQTVQNVYATQDGNDILVNYTLVTATPCEVSLLLSSDNGVTWQGILTDCIGDVGKNISGGQKQIKWDVLANQDQLVGKGFQFKIIANGKSEFEPEMVFVEGGIFQMGSETGERDEMPIRAIELSSFSIGKYEVTQAQWTAIMGYNPSSFSGCDNCPVEFVSWVEVQTYVSKLNHLTGKKYRLPTEAEWEYSARGGKKGMGYVFSGSNDLNSVAWNSSNSLNITHPVGLKIPNELGIYDMTGNVWEWCSDWYGNYSSSSLINPRGAVSGKRRVVRGGCWSYYSPNAYNSIRYQYRQDNKQSIIGFRLVLP
jgi:formylglycine-generating enzyme required for sulfatase activity